MSKCTQNIYFTYIDTMVAFRLLSWLLSSVVEIYTIQDRNSVDKFVKSKLVDYSYLYQKSCGITIDKTIFVSNHFYENKKKGERAFYTSSSGTTLKENL